MSILSAIAGAPSTAWKIGGAVALCVSVVAGAAWYRHALIQDGVHIESNRRDAIDLRAKTEAESALSKLNGQVLDAKALLLASKIELTTLKTEAQSAQTASTIRESALRSGAERLRATFIENSIAQAGPLGAGPAGRLDSQSAFTAELEPAVAANLDQLAATGDQAIRRLNACIVQYDAAKKAVDTAQK